MPNGDTQLQYPFPYKNSGNDISIAPNSTFNLFDCIDLIVQNTATVGGILLCNAISSSGNLDALSANFQQTINAPNYTSITNFSNGSSATAELRFYNNLSDYIRIGIGASTSVYPSRGFIDTTDGAGLTIKNDVLQDTLIINGTNELINFSATGVNIKSPTTLSTLTPSKILSLDASSIVTTKNTTGTGDVVLNASPTFTGTSNFATITCSSPIGTASGGTGLNTVGSNGTFLSSNGSSLSWNFPTVANLTAGTNISIAGSGNLTISVSGTIAIGNGGTGLNSLGTPGQYLEVNPGGTALQYKTPTFVTSVGLTTPSLFTVTNSPITSSGNIALSYTAGQYLPVTSGGSGVGTSTGTGSVVLNNSPTFITPNIDGATGSSLALTVAGTSSTTPITSYQPSLAASNTNTIKLGVSSTVCANLSFNNTTPNNLGFGFNNLTDVVNINPSGVITTSSNGGIAGNITGLPPAGVIGEIFGDAIAGTGGFLYGTITTTNPSTTLQTISSLTFNKGIYAINFRGETLISGTPQVTFTITIGGTTVETIITEGINNKYLEETFNELVRITVDGTVVEIKCILSTGTTSLSSWFISAIRS